MKSQLWTGIATVLLCAGLGGCAAATPNQTSQNAPRVHHSQTISKSNVKTVVRVMAVGGSVAYGWDDKTGGGFLPRAFTTLSKTGGVHYQFYNKSIEGDGPGKMAPMFSKELNTLKPQMLVIAWGILDDLANKTPIDKFSQYVHSEIATALASHMDVLVVTTPATPASYSKGRGPAENQYVHQEILVAKSFHSGRVHIFDVFNQMKAYISAHHQTIDMYAGDGWHPNTAGHELAARLLVQDFIGEFGKKSS